MKAEVQPKRLLMLLGAGLALLGLVAFVASGEALHMGAATAGYVRANLDLLAGKRVLHVSSLAPYSESGRPAQMISSLGLPTQEMYYSCLASTPCGSFHRAYDSQVRKEINRKFGYDVTAEVQNQRRTAISIVIHHK